MTMWCMPLPLPYHVRDSSDVIGHFALLASN